MSREITLTKGKVAILDDEDYDWFVHWKWSTSGTGYAYRHEAKGGIQRYIWLHREILNAPLEFEVDHVNRDKLDNRRCNLRLATQSQNVQNRAPYASKTSIFKGVHLRLNRWEARITLNRKTVSVGRFLTQREAALAYNDAAAMYFGEFAVLNDISILASDDDIPLIAKVLRVSRSHQIARRLPAP